MLALPKTYLEIDIHQNPFVCLEFFSSHALLFYERKDVSLGNFQTTSIHDVFCVVSEHWSSKIRSDKYLLRFEFSSHLSPVYC